jgi:hypothetical protein
VIASQSPRSATLAPAQEGCSAPAEGRDCASCDAATRGVLVGRSGLPSAWIWAVFGTWLVVGAVELLAR